MATCALSGSALGGIFQHPTIFDSLIRVNNWTGQPTSLQMQRLMPLVTLGSSMRFESR